MEMDKNWHKRQQEQKSLVCHLRYSQSGIEVISQVPIISGLRLILVPTCVIDLIFVFRTGGILPEDPLLRMVLLIESITPTAIGVLIMCQLHVRAQKYLAYLQFWMYLFSLSTMIVWLSVFIWLVF